MAVRYEEVDVLRDGIKYDHPTKGSFALNLIRRYGAWEVRRGFGQLTQLDTTLTNNITIPGRIPEWGYQKHLGSHVMHTNFGHDQLISVFRARVYTSETQGYVAQIADIYTVSIYDLTTRERWEEPLYRHTSESGANTKADLEFRHGNYETNQEQDYQAWLNARADDPFMFVEVRDILYFGSKSTELYAYMPSTFRGWRRRSVAGAHLRRWAPPYSESSMVWRVMPSPGAFPEAFAYRTQASVPSPSGLAVWNGRLVIAGNDRELFFSQRDRPTVFIAEDFIIVPTERPITALSTVGQFIYIFTDTETWVYQPSSGSELASQGMEPVRVSESVGCVSQNCIAKTGDVAVWLSSQGVHLSGGDMTVTDISGDIAPLFTDFITDPATSFFAATSATTGGVNLSNPQRNSVITLKTDGASVAYSQRLGAILVTLPEERLTLCYSGDAWSLWSYESNTNDAAGGAKVGAVQNISDPWLVPHGREIYLVGSLDTQSLTDHALSGGDVAAPVSDSVTSSSYYVLQYGRGGAIDRSIDDEDHRTIAGKYKTYFTAGALNYMVLGEWLPVAQGYKFNGAASGSAAPSGEVAPAAPAKTVLIPVYIAPHAGYDYDPTTAAVEKIEITFKFDNTHWRPVFEDGTSSTVIDLILPTERVSSESGWSLKQCQVAATGAADRAGDLIKLTWDGSTGAGWSTHPLMNLAPQRLNPLCYIPMRTISDAQDVSGMGIAKHSVDWCLLWDNGVPTSSTTNVLAWEQWRLVSVRKEDSVAQPVDWAYMCDQVGLPTDIRIKARGVVATMLSHDQGTDKVSTWGQGLFNTLIAADLKTWMAQVVDYIGDTTTFTKPVSISTNIYPTSLEHGTVRDRIEQTGGALVRPDFSGGAVYGNSATTTFEANTCLIGDEQVDQIITSDSVKGGQISVMLFGFMRNSAERLKFQGVKLLYRVVGGARRRRGR